jgi:hypothetical protein
MDSPYERAGGIKYVVTGEGREHSKHDSLPKAMVAVEGR